MSVELRPARTGRDQPPPVPSGGGSRIPWRSRLSRLEVKVSPYLFISPFYVVFLIFGAFPLVFTAWMSLRDRELSSGLNEFVGLRNYTDLLVDGEFWTSVVNTLGIFVVSTVPQLLLALLLANVLNRRMRASTMFRIGMIAPLVTSTAAVAIVFTQLFNVDYGLVNWLLGLAGIDHIDWQASRGASWIAISTMVNWRWIGYNGLIYLAAMQAIPKDLYEAAAIDGASRRRQFWRITVPLLRPTIVFTVIVSTIGGLQLFTEPVLYGGGRMEGGPVHQYQTISMYMFDNAFRNDDYGYGAAVAWMLFLLIIAFSLLNFLIVRRTGGTK